MRNFNMDDALVEMLAGVIIASAIADLTKNGEPTENDYERVRGKLGKLVGELGGNTEEFDKISKIKKPERYDRPDKSDVNFEKVRVLTQTLVERDMQVKELDDCITSLKATLVEREAEIDRNDEIIAVMDEQIKKLNEELAKMKYKIATVEDLEQHVRELSNEGRELVRENEELKLKIERLRSNPYIRCRGEKK